MTLMVVSIAVIVVVVFGGSSGCGGGGVGCDHVGEIRFTCKAPWS